MSLNPLQEFLSFLLLQVEFPALLQELLLDHVVLQVNHSFLLLLVRVQLLQCIRNQGVLEEGPESVCSGGRNGGGSAGSVVAWLHSLVEVQLVLVVLLHVGVGVVAVHA